MEARAYFEHTIRRVQGVLLYAVLDKTRSKSPSRDVEFGDKETFAGTIGLLNPSVEHAEIEIGHIVILPNFQRTHVTSNSIGLLLSYCFGRGDQGLEMRRVQWQAHAEVRIILHLFMIEQGWRLKWLS